VLSSLVALTISTTLTLIALPFLDTTLGPRLLLLAPTVVLLVAFTAGLSLVLAALHVYVRDVRHLVQAALLVWFYGTPIFYPTSLLKGQQGLLDFNPMTSVVGLFRRATIGSSEALARPLAVTLIATVVLWVVAVEVYRRHDRLFADRL
jgi:ABC-type polysaccharide/polyol phosphate export permease